MATSKPAATSSTSKTKYAEVSQADLARLMQNIPPTMLDAQRRRHGLGEQVPMSYTTGEELEKLCMTLIDAFNQKKLSDALKEHKARQPSGEHAAEHATHEHKERDSPLLIFGRNVMLFQEEESFAEKLVSEGIVQPQEKLKSQRCSNQGCDKRSSETNPFKACARCAAPYCSKCQVADWKAGHKAQCKPSTNPSGPSSPADARKRKIIADLLPNMLPELSMLGVGWHQRFGRGIMGVHSKDFAVCASDEQSDDAQIYVDYIPEADIAAHPRSADLLPAWHKISGYNSEQAVPVAFLDSSSSLVLSTRVCPSYALVKAALRPELLACDILALDTNNACFYLFNFHNVKRLVVKR